MKSAASLFSLVTLGAIFIWLAVIAQLIIDFGD